jgi:hypothetical protein
MKIAIIGATGCGYRYFKRIDIVIMMLQLRETKRRNNEVVKWIRLCRNGITWSHFRNDLVINAYSAGWTNPNFTTIFLSLSKQFRKQ